MIPVYKPRHVSTKRLTHNDISIDNKTRIYHAANTSDISIDNKIRNCLSANTSDISI
jgi:hypothetical protein